jgi:peptide-methionine (S)-S-oxide reductase
VVRTRVGYAGGATIDPTYHDLADHTEVFQIDYDPRVISYDRLLDEIWRDRRGGRAYSRQYMDAVFPLTPAQERAAKARVSTPIVAGARFYLAEDYHQKYYLRHDATLMKELAAYTPAQLVESRVAARLNGYVAGKGTPAQLREELPLLGLSAAASAHLEQLVGQRAGMLCG